MQEKLCQDCQHYIQHYGLDNQRIFRVFCGHCTASKSKRKRPDTPACPQFAPAPSPTEAFVTKEYLSKELLKYIMELDLLPDIQ